MRAITIGLVALMMSGGAQAQRNANDLLSKCTVFEREARSTADGIIHYSSDDAHYCLAYVNAVFGLVEWQEPRNPHWSSPLTLRPLSR